MPRFAGIKNGQIKLVSNTPCNCRDIQTIEIDDSLKNISAQDLIANFKFKNNKIVSRLITPPFKEAKIALVGNWKMRCGIATYSENLWAELIKHAGDFKLFIENNELPTDNIYQVGSSVIPENKLDACWKRGNSLQDLISKIKKYDPDIVLIQHEFGLFPNARHWLSLMTQLSHLRVIVVMHSVFPYHQDKIVYEAAMPEIIVHLEGAKNNLKKEKHLNGKVHVIPHGCYPIINQEKLWDNYKSPHTFIQQGFGFKYKNFENSIRATALLKNKYPNVFFTALFSESPYNRVSHQMYYNELLDLINELNLQDNVSIIRGYQSDQTLDTYLRSNQAAVFPYMSVPGHEVFGASGAARLAMAAGIPIITSSIPHFSDLPSPKADTPEQISQELDQLFGSKTIREQQIIKQNQFIIDHSWEKIARQYIAVFENNLSF